MRSSTSSSRPQIAPRRGVFVVMALLAGAAPVGAAFEAHPLVATPSASALLVVGDALDGAPVAALDTQLVDHLGGGFALTVVGDGDLTAADVAAVDVVVLSSTTSASEFRPFLLKTSVPVVALKASSWTALGLAPFGDDDATPLQTLAELEVAPVDHPVVAGLDHP